MIDDREKTMNFVLTSAKEVSKSYSLLLLWDHDNNTCHCVGLSLVSFNFCRKFKVYNMCSYLLHGFPVAGGTAQAYRNDICMRFLLLVLYQFPSSFRCLIEAVCHSYWYSVSVNRSEKYIAVAHFTLALLNLSISCSECSIVFWYCFNFFSGLRVI